MYRQIIHEARITRPEQYTTAVEAHRALGLLKRLFGEAVWDVAREKIDINNPIFDIDLSINGMDTTFHGYEYRDDGVLLGELTGGHEFVLDGETHRLLEVNCAALAAGTGDIHRLEARYCEEDDAAGLDGLCDTESYLAPNSRTTIGDF